MAKPAPTPPTTLDLLKQQFAALCPARDAALAQAETTLAAELGRLDAQIGAIEAPLVSIVQQIAQISTALNGQTAQPNDHGDDGHRRVEARLSAATRRKGYFDHARRQ